MRLDPGWRFDRGALDVLAECRRLGVEVASLETCFLPPPAELDAATLVAAACGVEIVVAWGHPHGLELGSRRDRREELRSWIELAPTVGCALVRLVAASPRFRPDGRLPGGAIERIASVLADACRWADEAGVELALENHGDLTAREVEAILGLVASPTLGVCLDTANALRVGDDSLEAARALAGVTRMVHLKDCEAPGLDPLTGPHSVPYGDGVVPLESILGVLAAAGFAGPVCVELGHLGPGEVDEVALVERSVEWLARNRWRELGDGDPARAGGDHPPQRVRNDRG